MENIFIARCVYCNNKFTEEEIKGQKSCPSCGTHHLPSDPNNDVILSINTHELRCLSIWADHYASSVDNKTENLDNAYYESLCELLDKINERIHKQLKIQNKDCCLTLREEMSDLHANGINADLYRNNKLEM